MEWQNGGIANVMAEWQNGNGMAELRNGGMAESRNGGMADGMALWSRSLKLWQWRWVAGSSCAVLDLSIASSKKVQRFTFLRTFYMRT